MNTEMASNLESYHRNELVRTWLVDDTYINMINVIGNMHHHMVLFLSVGCYHKGSVLMQKSV